MKHARLTIALGLAALTAACGKKAETPVAVETNQAAPAAAMSGDMGSSSRNCWVCTSTSYINPYIVIILCKICTHS